ncbi:hypothetical protein CBR_g21118 [Chara braunii]|nr:hypothetical protein CBR_g21118 [Chara braunii]|eukprot:GBG75875.1 hypothetical protein CBR_g21118 [Chara braunii]
MYLLTNTLLQGDFDRRGSFSHEEDELLIPESKDDEFEEREIKEAFRAEEYNGIYLMLGLLLSCEMRDRDASDKAQKLRHLYVLDIIAALHDGIAGGHRGIGATCAKISELYHWDGMLTMVIKYCQSCVPCEERSAQRPEEPLHPRLEREVGAVVHLDLLFMPVGGNGCNYIFDARDNLTGFVDGRAIRTKTGPVLANCIEEFYLRYPFVKEFVMDRGSEFTCNEVRTLLAGYGVVANYTTVAHPQANAPVERGHSTITNLLAKWTEGKPGQWPKFLRATFFVENITVKRTTKYAPATLWYGRHATFPIESFMKTWRRQDLEVNLSFEELLDIQARQVGAAEERLREAAGQVERSRMEDKMRWDQMARVRKEPLAVGDSVLLYDSSLEKQWSRKLDKRWLGPYRIVRCGEFGAYQIEELNGTEWKDWVSGTRLKKSDFLKAAMQRGGRGTRPRQRPLGASGGEEQHGPFRRELTPVFDDDNIELFLDAYQEHAARRGWDMSERTRRSWPEGVAEPDSQEAPVPPPEVTMSPRHEDKARGQVEGWRTEPRLVVDSHLVAHAAEHPDIEEPSLVGLSSGPAGTELEEGLQAAIGEVAEAGTGKEPDKAAQAKRARVRARLEEIHERRDRMEAAGIAPRPLVAPKTSEERIDELWARYEGRREAARQRAREAGQAIEGADEAIEVGELGFAATRRAIEWVDKEIKQTSIEAFQRYSLLSDELALRKDEVEQLTAQLAEERAESRAKQARLEAKEAEWEAKLKEMAAAVERLTATKVIDWTEQSRFEKSCGGEGSSGSYVTDAGSSLLGTGVVLPTLHQGLCRDCTTTNEFVTEGPASQLGRGVPAGLCNPQRRSSNDPSKQFILITDWQPEAIFAILAQKGNDGREHVIEYASRTVPDERRNDSAPQGECYAVIWGIQHFHPYLYGQKCRLVTEHEPLLALKKLTNYMGMIGRWAVRLQEYDFDIVHRKTERHGNADGLTRLHRPAKVPKGEEITPWKEPDLTNEPKYGQVAVLPRGKKQNGAMGDGEFVELSFCLLRVDLNWTWEGDQRPASEIVELLVIQIVRELTIVIARLVDELPLDIISQSDEEPVPHTLSRTLAPSLQWSACIEERWADDRFPSRSEYLNVHSLTNPRFFRQPTTFEWAALRAEEEAEEESEGELRREVGEAAARLAKDEEEEREAEEESAEEEEEEEAEEETSEEEEEAYSEYSEGEQSEEEDEDDEEVESGSDQEPTHDELEWVPGPDRREGNPEAAAQRKKEIAEGKRLAIDPAPNDPFKDPEPPKPEHGDLAATTSGAVTTRRRSRSRS